MSRRKARDITFKYIYSMYFGKSNNNTLINTILSSNEQDTLKIEKEENEFLDNAILLIDKNLSEIDKKILSKLKNWTIERIFKIDLAILRLAVYELEYSKETPYKVVVNEAVELAKKYGNDESYTFINGVLREIIKEGQNK